MEEEKYPAWLADKLLNKTFSWKEARQISMTDLLEHVTLHDSYWYNSILGNDNSLLLIINLDAIWNKEFCHNLEDWPFLIIRIKDVLCTFQNFSDADGFYTTIGLAETKPVNIPDFKEWVDFTKVAELFPPDFYQRPEPISDLNRTVIDTIYGGALAITHHPSVEILLYSEQGEQLAVILPA